METERTAPIPAAKIVAARKRAQEARKKYAHKPDLSDLLTPQELEDGAPFYRVLRDYVWHLKKARVAAGLTLADVSKKTGIAVESLSRLETGSQTNPTWKTLGLYAAAIGRCPRLTSEDKQSVE